MTEALHYRVTRPALKDPDEVMPIRLDWYKFCANIAERNERYDLGEVVRPETPTGFAYQAQNTGVTASRKPRWPLVLTQTILDGSVTWLCIEAETNGLNTLETPTAYSDPPGLTIGSLVVEEACKLSCTYADGLLDQDYAAVFTVTLNGLIRIARQLVQVRRR